VFVPKNFLTIQYLIWAYDVSYPTFKRWRQAGGAHNLWRIELPKTVVPSRCLPSYEPHQALLLHQTDQQPDAEYVRFVHAALGSPPPTTFLRAVARGFITSNGPRQFSRLTTKMVRRNMPNSEASARGHLRKTPTAQPHAQSEAVSALRRHHNAKAIRDLWRQMKTKAKSSPLSTFDPTKAPRSTTLHFDYTGALPERCTSGTL
jgi:hypothetical protein